MINTYKYIKILELQVVSIGGPNSISAVALRCLATAGGFLPGYNGDVVLKGAAQTSDGGFVDGSSATVFCKVSVFSCML